MIVFCDTSALAKRYISERGSTWLCGLLSSASSNEIVISRITRVELISALARRERGGSISPQDALAARQAFSSHCAHQYLVVQLQEMHFRQAETLAAQHGLRAYDAMQLAVAVVMQRTFMPLQLVFVSADDELNRAAITEGLSVENPNHHP